MHGYHAGVIQQTPTIMAAMCGLKRIFSTSPELNVSVSRTALCVAVGELYQQEICDLNTLTPHVST